MEVASDRIQKIFPVVGSSGTLDRSTAPRGLSPFSKTPLNQFITWTRTWSKKAHDAPRVGYLPLVGSSDHPSLEWLRAVVEPAGQPSNSEWTSRIQGCRAVVGWGGGGAVVGGLRESRAAGLHASKAAGVEPGLNYAGLFF